MQEKPIRKQRWLWILGITVALIIVACGCSNKNTKTNDPGISKAEYDQLENGMTYDEAKAIIGGPGELFEEMGSEGDPYHLLSYQFIGEGKQGINCTHKYGHLNRSETPICGHGKVRF